MGIARSAWVLIGFEFAVHSCLQNVGSEMESQNTDSNLRPHLDLRVQ